MMVSLEARRFGQGLGNALEILCFRARQERAGAPVIRHVQRVLVSDQNDSVARQFAAIDERGRGFFAAIVPGQFRGRPCAFGREFISDDGPIGRSLVVHAGRPGFHACRCAQSERKKCEVHAMTGHVAQGTGSEIPKAAPFERHVSRMVWPPGSDAEPQIPIERRRHRWCLLRPLDALRPPVARPVGPDVNLPHLAQHARLNQLHQSTRVGTAMTLIAHLRGDFVLPRDLGHLARLGHRMGERLLAINVFAHLHRHEGGRGVHVVGRRNGHGIDIPAFLLQHQSEIFELPGLRIFFECPGAVDFIHIAQGVNVLIIHVGDVAGAFSAHADAGDVQAVVCTKDVATGYERKGHRGGRGGGRAFHKLATAEELGFHDEFRHCVRPFTTEEAGGSRIRKNPV